MTFSKYWSSQRASDSKFPYNAMQIYNTNEAKGYIDPDIIIEVGGANSDHGRFFAGPEGPYVKLMYYHALPWATGIPLQPPAPYGPDYNGPNKVMDDWIQF